MGVLHVIWKVGHPKIISTQISEQKMGDFQKNEDFV
jgi:hypothetical protein